MRLLALGLGIGLLGAGCAPTLLLRPLLVAANPAPGAWLGKAPRHLELTFNRALASDSTQVHLARASDDWQPALETSFDHNRLDLQLAEPLGPGRYTLAWHAVNARHQGSADGELSFGISGERGGRVPQVTVSQSETDAGQVIEVRGQGWQPQQELQLKIGDEEIPFGSAHTDAHGNFSVPARVPDSVAFGIQPVSAVDAREQRAMGAVRVRWGGWPPLVAWTTGSAGPRPGEVTFSISLRNRSDYLLEAVQVEVPEPAGASVVAVDGGHLERGRLVWDIPTFDRGEMGPLRMVFASPGPIAIHAGIHFRHRRPMDCHADECLSAFVSETSSDSPPVGP